MTSVLLSALAGLGAAEHLVGVAAALRARGHRVSVVTAAETLPLFRHLDVEVHAVPEPPMPELSQSLPPVLQRAHQVFRRVQQNIIDPLPEQAAVVERVIRDAAVEVVITDALFLGASMLSALPRAARPAIVMLGFFAPWMPDPDVPPYGLGVSPADNQTNRLRSALFSLAAARAYALLSRSFNTAVERAFGVPRRGDLRSSPNGADVWAQLTVARFEYPRSALPPNFRFIGPLHPPQTESVPEWWDPAREPPVIVVRTARSSRLTDLVIPTIRAFEGTGDTVVITGVPRHIVAAANGGPLPENVHFEARPPWPRLIPQRTVVVSDGDYLHTQHALRFGIPVVVAGTLETDVETAARVSWAGVGIDLRTRRPEASAVRAAVETIRADPGFRLAAAKIAAQIASTNAEEEIVHLIERLGAP